METEFQALEFAHRRGRLAPSAHIVAYTSEDGEQQKWRWCLTMNDDGSWQWDPGPPEWVKVPAEVTQGISAKVKEMVAEHGIERKDD